MRLFHRDRPPDSVLALFDAHERAVSWADTADGEVVVATQLGLWWPFVEGMRRISWQRISKAVWQDGALAVVEGDVEDGVISDRPVVSARLTTPRDLPPVVRKRVNLNIVKTELVSVGGGAVRFVQRRIPGADGAEWSARLEPGTPPTAETIAAVRARLARLRELSGQSTPDTS
jgi:hypothetical protein